MDLLLDTLKLQENQIVWPFLTWYNNSNAAIKTQNKQWENKVRRQSTGCTLP